MRVEQGGQQTGKTKRMIQWLRDNENAVLLTINEAEAERLRERFDPTGIYELANRIIGASRYGAMRGLTVNYPAIAIDNVDLLLQEMFGDVQYVSMTKENGE